MNTKLIKRILLGTFALTLLVISTLLLVAYTRQDAIVQSQLVELNKTYSGQISVGKVHLAPFKNFPYISVRIDDVVIRENKDPNSPLILDVKDIYVGFSIWDLAAGNYDIQSLIIEDGYLDIVLHTDGTTNLVNAISSPSQSESSPALDIHLRKISLKNLDIHQREEATNLDIQTLIYWAEGGFNSNDAQIAAHVDTEFELNVIDDGDTTYFKDKHFEFHTDLTYDESSGMLRFEPSGITLEHGDFELEGSIDTKQEMTVDISIKGTKPSFDMFIAFAPTEIIPVLERYENAGNIYLNASLKGPTTNGRQPLINAEFGASEAYLENSSVKKRINEMGFSGHFTNGESRDFSTMEFLLEGMSANLEQGQFKGSLLVKNFEAPDIDMSLDADFDLGFIASFLELSGIQNASGRVAMQLRFHDIIDLDYPERALDELNQAYFAELKIEDLSIDSDELPASISDLDAHLIMNGNKAELDQFDLILGNSNLSITGFLSDLPAIVHHTPNPVNAHLEIKSDLLDIKELSNYSEKDSSGIDEQIENLSLAFSFDALGNAFTEYKHLPVGEFFIDDFYADLKHYPHTLHDFHADILVKDEDLKIVDFSGFVDDSDFHFNGLIRDYSFWMQDQLNGDVEVDITLKSNLLRLKDLFAYQGKNYVPEDYQHEEFDKLEIHMTSRMNYKQNTLQAIDIQMDKLLGKMKIHPLRFEDFSGRFHFEDEQLRVENFHGKMGKTVFDISMDYYLGENPEKAQRQNSFSLTSAFIDFDALSNFTPEPPKEKNPTDERSTEDVIEHAEAFNLYELPFSDMRFQLDVDHFMYHRLDLKNVVGQFRTTRDHFIYVDSLSLDAAGGNIAMNGYFNGSDPKHIYLKPNMTLTNVDLDKLLFKFENFGQDAIVSENLHGQLSADITGNIRVYPDFVPDLDQSEVHMDVKVVNGRLENYDPVMMLSDYFGDKDLTNIRFDTLQNHMDITNGIISIPNMTIASTLGQMDLSGTQDMNNTIDYYVRIPWSLVKQAARNKIFGVKKEDGSQQDEIIELDPNKKVRYLNLNITGTLDEYDIKVRKPKK
ncbi:AsmA-like C-terminal region-containing protein [Algoriphagus namhaensis]|uniref:AsmA-like C-terminal region-containing protein n=1 Tax=Algoriphagus namhaensis TaxID=915353 RepID=A0ABV8AW84_9BACT